MEKLFLLGEPLLGSKKLLATRCSNKKPAFKEADYLPNFGAESTKGLGLGLGDLLGVTGLRA